jgi:threonylcarbamoyladenosine tRNA methylthiotransferase MtaB
MARGKSRSDTIANVVSNAEMLAARGIKEIVLTGVNLGDFGISPVAGQDGPAGASQRREHFAGLVQALETCNGPERYRISSIEPNLLTDTVIRQVAASTRFMPHFHIPLQSGSNKILALMRRRYQRELYVDRVQLIKSLMPHCAIGVDVIVGFPGETDEDFNETFDFLHSLDIAYLHVFTYSERDNTRALDIKPVVPVHIRHERNKALRNLSYMKMQYFTQQHSGSVRKVLFEKSANGGMMEGYTDNYIRVSAPYQPERVNKVVEWTL